MINFLQNIFKPKQKLPEMHFKPLELPPTTPLPIVNDTMSDYFNMIQNGQLPYAQNILNQYGAEKVKQGIQQGLNFGVPQIADWQKQYNAGAGRNNPINFPQTQEEIELAQQNKFNPVNFINGGVGTQPEQIRQGLFDKFLNGLQQVQSGYRENLKTPFEVDNLRPNENKTALNRIGEGLGTAVRFADKPIGRELIVGGLVGATGGSPLEMLSYGGQAGLINQTAKMRNDLYRQQLQNLGYNPKQISNIGGYVDNDTYKTLSDGYYKSQYNQYRNRKLDQDSYVKIKMMYDKQLEHGILTPQEYQNNMLMLNMRLVDDNITTADTGRVKQSNDTRKTDSTIKLNKQRGNLYDVTAGQMPVRTGIMQQNANTGVYNANTNRKRAEYYGKFVDKYGNSGQQGTKGSGRKNPNYGSNLAEYAQIVNSGDKNKINYARQNFMKIHGEDPDKALSQQDMLLQKYLGQ